MLLFIFFLTIIISYTGTYLAERLFLKFSLFIDKPEDRSIHKYPTPSAGGIPIIIHLFCTYLLYWHFILQIISLI